MSDADSPVALSVNHLEVEKVSIWKSERADTLVHLTPLLSVVITAVALLISTVLQVRQGSVTRQQTTEAAWRAALEKITLEDKQAIVAALEMQTFYEDERYGKQARALTTIILPKVTDPSAFDTALFAMRDSKQPIEEVHFLDMARSVTNDLRNLYDVANTGTAGTSLPKDDSSFERFVETPEKFLDERILARDLHAAQIDTWKLDSISVVLSSRWKLNHLRQVPANTDLSGIVLLNHDFSDIDFRNADMTGSSFAGNCHVRPEWVAPAATVHCRS